MNKDVNLEYLLYLWEPWRNSGVIQFRSCPCCIWNDLPPSGCKIRYSGFTATSVTSACHFLFYKAKWETWKFYLQRQCWGGSVSVAILRIWSLPTTKILPSKPNTASYKSEVWREAWCFLLFSIRLFWMEINNYTGNFSEVISVCCLFFLPFFLLRIWGLKPLMGNHKWKQTCSQFLLTETRVVLEDIINSVCLSQLLDLSFSCLAAKAELVVPIPGWGMQLLLSRLQAQEPSRDSCTDGHK